MKIWKNPTVEDWHEILIELTGSSHPRSAEMLADREGDEVVMIDDDGNLVFNPPSGNTPDE